MSHAARFQAFDLLATLVAVVRPHGEIMFANAALESALGTSRRTLQASRLSDWLTDPDALLRALQGIDQRLYAAWRYETSLLLPGASAAPVPVHVVVAPTDVPGDILVELLPWAHQAQQAREERWAEQAQAQQELIRNLAHEIKNPLGGIRGAAQLLQMQGAPEDAEYTQVIISEADRLHRLVDGLLAPHQLEHVPTQVNIHEVCERVRALLAAEFGHGLLLVRDYDTSIPEFMGDREQLIQVLLNLARNAAQMLSVRRAAGDARLCFKTRVLHQVTWGKQRHRLALELHVIDNGPGIAPALQERIFSPLVSGREGGSGLGLSLVQNFVHQHHGVIECDSRPGHTDFKLLLPIR